MGSIPSYGHSLESNSQRMMPQLYTSAGSAYFSFAKTSSAIHWTVPQLPEVEDVNVEFVNKARKMALRGESCVSKTAEVSRT
jgi:hypothetical protein